MTGFAVVKRLPLSRESQPDDYRYLIAISYQTPAWPPLASSALSAALISLMP